MPFDCLPDSPLARLLTADRKLTMERRAAAKLLRNPVPPEQIRRSSVAVLDRLKELLGEDGAHWIQGDYSDGAGGYCLKGGLQHIRAARTSGDHAGLYLSRAIREVAGGSGRITRFNDNCERYEQIAPVIARARELAEQDAGGEE